MVGKKHSADPLAQRRLNWLKAALLIGVTLVVYIPAMQGGFIWDDADFAGNPLNRHPAGLYSIWISPRTLDFYPMTSTCFWIEWQLWKDNPAGYHIFNIFLHVLDSLLLWRVLARLKIPGAWAASLIFAVHPVNVASVAWISEQKNTLAMVFYLLAIRFYLSFEVEKRWQWYGISLAAFVAGLLCKTIIVTLPLVLLWLAWWQRNRITRRDFNRVIPFFMLAVILGLITVNFQYHRAISNLERWQEPLLLSLAGIGWEVWFYLFKALAPVNLMMIYPLWKIDYESALAFLPDAVLAAVLVILWRYRRTWGRPVLFGLGYFMIMLLPILGLLKMSFRQFSLVSDHFQYFAIIGVIAPGVAILVRLAESKSFRALWGGKAQARRMAFIGFALLVFCLGCLTWKRAGLFADGEALWTENIQRNPDSPAVHTNLGFELAAKGRITDATEHYAEALRLNPGYVEAHHYLAIALERQGKMAEAEDHYKQALRLAPDVALAHDNLGLLLCKMGKTGEAQSYFTRAVELDPNDAPARAHLGMTLLDQKQPAEAIAQLAESLRLDEDGVEANSLLAWILATQPDPKLRNAQEAIRLAERACRLTEYKNPVIVNTLAAAYANADRFADAVSTGEKALALARQTGNSSLVRNLERHLSFYRSGQPYRE